MANSSKIVSGLFAANAIWHGAALYYFLLKPRSILGRLSNVRPISDQTVDVLKWLGALNSGYFLLSILGFVRSYKQNELRTTDLWILALFIFDLSAHANGRWKTRLLQITFFGGLFAFVDSALALLTLRYRPNKE